MVSKRLAFGWPFHYGYMEIPKCSMLLTIPTKCQLELSQSAAYPHTAPCNRTGVFLLGKKKNPGSA